MCINIGISVDKHCAATKILAHNINKTESFKPEMVNPNALAGHFGTISSLRGLYMKLYILMLSLLWTFFFSKISFLLI